MSSQARKKNKNLNENLLSSQMFAYKAILPKSLSLVHLQSLQKTHTFEKSKDSDSDKEEDESDNEENKANDVNKHN